MKDIKTFNELLDHKYGEKGTEKREQFVKEANDFLNQVKAEELDKAPEFKVLKHGHVFVNESMLYKGIYSTSRPELHSAETTIEGLAKLFSTYDDKVSETVLKCKLVTVKLVEI